MWCHKKGHKEKLFWEKQKDDENKEKDRDNATEEIYCDELFFGDDAVACENKTINKEIEQMFVANSGSTSHMVNILKNITNL